MFDEEISSSSSVFFIIELYEETNRQEMSLLLKGCGASPNRHDSMYAHG